MRHARVDQPGLLAAGDDLDREAECSFGPRQKIGDIACHAKGIGGDSPHAIGVKAAQAFAEALKHVDGALDRLVAQQLGGIQSRCKTNGFLEAIDLENVACAVFLDNAAN